VGRKNRLSRDEIATIVNGGLEGFAEPERAALLFADAMSATPTNISDDLYTLLQRHFTYDQLVEMAANVAQENYRARWNRVFELKSQGFYHMPSSAPMERRTA
jgi:alkylhydroperoxidase family enzyme